mgnify:CR=1 FL=1
MFNGRCTEPLKVSKRMKKPQTAYKFKGWDQSELWDALKLGPHKKLGKRRDVGATYRAS